MRHVFLGFVVCIGACMPAALGAQAEPLAAARVTPDELVWKALPMVPGLQRAEIVSDDGKAGVYVIRTRFPAGFKVKAHFHPDERIVTVISGTLLMGFGDKFDETTMKALPAGSIWTEPAKTPHYVWARDGEVVIQVMGVNGPSAVIQIEEK